MGGIVSSIGDAIGSVVSDVGSVVGDVGSAVANAASNVISNPIQTIADVGALATGNPELIPAINAGSAIANGANPLQEIGRAHV